MNYSEEDFYGNVQNTVDAEGQVQPIQDKEQPKKEKVNYTLTILSTFAKTLIVIIGSIFYLVSVSMSINTSFAIKIYEFFDAKDAVVVCYERVYNKSNSLNDLYNLVQKSIQAGDSKKTNKYIEILQSNSKYLEFCHRVNHSVKQVTEKKYYAYVGDLDSYLISQNIIALYENGKKEKALNLALTDLTNNNIYSTGIATYIDLLMNDTSLEFETREQNLNALLNEKISNKTIMEHIEIRIEVVDYSEASDVHDCILRVYTALKLNNLKFNIYSYTNAEAEADSVRLEIERLQDVYESLLD